MPAKDGKQESRWSTRNRNLTAISRNRTREVGSVFILKLVCGKYKKLLYSSKTSVSCQGEEPDKKN